jgi:xylan 1,4-beta-xylosidase
MNQQSRLQVWNEPNCCPHDFFTANQSEYFRLFEVTSRAAKSVHPGIRVGGPATGQGLPVDCLARS